MSGPATVGNGLASLEGAQVAGTSSLILGVSGQDGSYLAQHLLEHGHDVWGMLRGQPEAHPYYAWLREKMPDVRLIGGDLLDAGSLRDAIIQGGPAAGFEEIYNLAAISSPGQAWQQPILTGDVTGLGVVRLLDAVQNHRPWIRVVQACSIATHGPYGAAKTYARTVCADYRARGLHVSTVLFGGHHSPRRAPVYFSRKVTQAAARIALNGGDLVLGSLDRSQDWGWAPDFMKGLRLVGSLAKPGEFVISTGEPHTCMEWVEKAFAAAGLDWQAHVKVDPSQGNVTDVPTLTAATDEGLLWQPKRDFDGLVEWMVEADLRRLANRG